MLDSIRSFISGLFAGMATSQARSGDYPGTKWRADLALKWASNPFSLAVAHAASAQAALMAKQVPAAKQHIALALSASEQSADVLALPEISELRRELLDLQAKLQ